jgi:hypothetical protein
MDTGWGRFKDIIKGQGPDMYLTINADKHDYMKNRPTRAQWSGWKHLDDEGLQPYPLNKTPKWTPIDILGGRSPGKSYDFRTRKYARPNRYTWTDAVWQPEPRKNKYNRYPEAVRDVRGEWYQNPHYLPQELGGPVDNELGRGLWGHHRNPYLR